MGKKSKRCKSNNKSSQCYHGCTKKEFNNRGEHYKVVEDWSQIELIDDDETYNEDRIDEFYKTHKRVMDDPTFGRYAIAHITDDYLKGKDDTNLLHHLALFLDVRYFYIPRNEGKDVGLDSEITKNYNKYCRDVRTERGRIKFMAREIPCKCMEEKRIAAKLMEKTAVCFECRQEFPKELLLRCIGCDHVQYCSNECSIKHWPNHKEWCKQNSVSSASKTGS
mmetsp:Transcript_11949/g.13518  ORF Transcript_11949/g.13518 Transcript_11949/m.13518 type:complete len:222 (+) Transcript_11949:50-715(+)